jgi:Fe-S-cluster containining protein
MNEQDPKQRKGRDLRMDPEHVFKFDCSQDVPCFTKCCQDVTIALTPYDVLRLKNGLSISSDKFLDDYTIIRPQPRRLIPFVILKMNDQDKKCPFVTQEGCTVYQDRPWPCRMYPLDVNDDGTFCLITDASHCLGLKEEGSWRIYEWLMSQEILPYDKMNDLFSEVTLPLRAQELDIDNPDISKMVVMALYNLDRFREFVFNSSFLNRFDIDPLKVVKLQKSDEELLKFAFDWIKFGIFGQKVLRVKQQQEEKAQE